MEVMKTWQYFSYVTDPLLMCPCCGMMGMQDGFMHKQDQLRRHYGKPLVVSSGYRCPEYNAKISTTGADGPHTTGRAIDYAVSGHDAYRLLLIMFALSDDKQFFTGIGINQKGSHNKRFIHGDDLASEETRGPRPWVWTY